LEAEKRYWFIPTPVGNTKRVKDKIKRKRSINRIYQRPPKYGMMNRH